MPRASTRLGKVVYLRKASGEIIAVARQGDPAPGGGRFRLAFGPVLNDRGEIAFMGDLMDDPDPSVAGKVLTVFLQFLAGPEPPATGPEDCGADTTPDSLGCSSYGS